MMAYEFIKHTADIRLKIAAKTQNELYSEAVRGMMAQLGPEAAGNEPTTRKIKIESSDPTSLLVDFLSEILTLSQINKEAYSHVEFEELSDKVLSAKLTGIPVKFFEEDIKGVTYHEAKVTYLADGSWEALVIFDI